MFKVLGASLLAPDIKRFEIHAPRIARKFLPGQFVIVRLHRRGERIPLTIASARPGDGSISLIVQGVGKTTRLMNTLETGDALLNVVGPLGRPSEIRRFGHVVVVGGGVGAAIAYPVATALRSADNRVTVILGARTRELVILEEAFRSVGHVTHVMTDDGSHGEKGVVTDRLRKILDSGVPVDRVLAIGPVAMMAAVAETTRPHGTPTIVSLNSIMVDGTGMCGGCRVLIGGKSEFACVDGPEFDAHRVNFEVLAMRNAMYREAERQALEQYQRDPARDRELVDEVCRAVTGRPELANVLPKGEEDHVSGEA